LANLDIPDLPIGEVARRTGVPVATLRMWETRYGFPQPRRGQGGHRRYTDRDCVLLREVKHERDAGVRMSTAIERAQHRAATAEQSLYDGVRHRHPQVDTVTLPEPFMLAISRAIEQESSTYGQDAMLIGCFQHRRAWLRAERRWRALAERGHTTVVFADFPEVTTTNRLVQVPIEAGMPIEQEWAVICDGPHGSACVVGIELPRPPSRPQAPRRFEALWSVDPAVARDAARLGIGLGVHAVPELARLSDGLARRADAPPNALQHASALTNRVIVNALDIARTIR
jgi:DNA-binding transcriptional MerR regulator